MKSIETTTQQRADLKQTIKVKKQMLDMYEKEINRLESEAANLRGAAEAIEAGLRKAEGALANLK